MNDSPPETSEFSQDEIEIERIEEEVNFFGPFFSINFISCS
jgi:hypothetical protein